MTLGCNTVFVLGASGFIGGRLVEKLFLEHGHVPKCLVRNYEKLPRMARFPVDIVHGDVLHPETFESEIGGCNVFVFCVLAKERNLALNWKVNTEGLKNMLELAVKNKVRQFIFLSTTAIYESSFDIGQFDESIIPIWKKKDYAGGKLEGEKICLSYADRHGLGITILRPTIVYGPFAESWTIYPAELVRSGALRDYHCFSGLCNPVYVDDVVNVIIKCIMNKNTLNETFIVSSGETISWNRFFNAFSITISGKPLEKSSRLQFLAKALPIFCFKKGLKLFMHMAPDFSRSAYSYIRSKGSGDWNWAKGQDISTLKPRYFTKRLEFRIDKLRNKLRYEPQYDFDRGFKITADWLKHHRYPIKRAAGGAGPDF